MGLQVSDETFSIICVGVVMLIVTTVYILAKYAK